MHYRTNLFYDGFVESYQEYDINLNPEETSSFFVDTEIFGTGSYEIMVEITPSFNDTDTGNNIRTETLVVD